MSAPQFVPTDPVDRPRTYRSPDHVPGAWSPDRPAELEGLQPAGPGLGYQGPDQGFGLTIARRFAEKVTVQTGEHVEDALSGCTVVALRRASMYGRAPVIHDFTIAFTIWGFLDPVPPAELVALRKPVFDHVGDTLHHYAEGRAIAESVPESTLRQTPAQVAAAYPSRWRELLGR